MNRNVPMNRTRNGRTARQLVTVLVIMGAATAWTGRAVAQMDHGSMQGGSPPPDARDPHAYSDGLRRAPDRPLRLADEDYFGSVLFDRLELVRTGGENTGAYDMQARFGRDYDRAVLKAEGEVADGKLDDTRTELLWGHAVAAYWDTQLGARYDGGHDLPGRSWLAVGVQGLAPYWFHVDASAYVGESWSSALRLELEYELLLTQRLVLQPRVDANFYGKDDPERMLGSGLSNAVVGLRLRYEILREFAPYVGIEYAAKFGGTADYAKAAGDESGQTRYVAGLRVWY